MDKSYLNEIEEAIKKATEITRKTLPYLTGNLSINAFKLEKIDENKYKLYIDLQIAPYAKHIDRQGYRSYKYFDKSIEIFMNILKSELNGSLISL